MLGTNLQWKLSTDILGIDGDDPAEDHGNDPPCIVL